LLYYDITEPFNDAAEKVTLNEKGGFFGGTTIAISPKKIAEKLLGHELDRGVIADVSLKYEMEHVSKFDMLHYDGLNWDLKVVSVRPNAPDAGGTAAAAAILCAAFGSQSCWPGVRAECVLARRRHPNGRPAASWERQSGRRSGRCRPILE
jgi:hypothetical protein